MDDSKVRGCGATREPEPRAAGEAINAGSFLKSPLEGLCLLQPLGRKEGLLP